ncbi:MAG TPA: ABC transporter permease [Candidatus Limnocylindria bacterium]|jgi:peptide/nickel transport system permease protein
MQRRIDPWLAVGLAIASVLLFVGVYGERIAPNEPFYLLVNAPGGDVRPLPPGRPFLFGSDALGRDLFSLVLAGARTTLAIVVLAGLARLAVGFLLAVTGSWSHTARLALDGLADLVSAVPSTIVAVFFVLAFGQQGAPAAVFVGALLVTGWAGPYRVLRAELGRLRVAQFTQGARALGVRRREVLLRHHLPHLVPVLAVSASQQIATALVALAELGVIGIFVGPRRAIDLAEAMAVVPNGARTGFGVPDVPEWGGLLALGRGIENLYVTRWAFLVPGTAIALAAVGATILGIGIARQYRRRNLLHDLRSPITAVVVVSILLSIVPSFVLPDRYAVALELGHAARDRAVIGADAGAALAAAGLAVTPVERRSTSFEQVGTASLEVDADAGRMTFREGPGGDFVPLLFGPAGGGTANARLVFAGWGISPLDYPPTDRGPFSPPDLGQNIATWQDDLATVAVLGAIVVLLRLPNIRLGRGVVQGPAPDVQLRNLIARHPAAILYVDGQRGRPLPGNQADPYRRLAAGDPLGAAAGTPVLLLGVEAADRILAPLGARASEILRSQREGEVTYTSGRSLAAALPGTARVDVPVAAVTTASRSLVALTPAAAGEHRLVVWAVAPSRTDGTRGAEDLLAAVARSLAGHPLPPLALVLFDPRGDTQANAKAVRAALGTTPLDVVLAIDTLAGSALRFTTAYGDLVAAFDAYATRTGAAALHTDATIDPDTAAAGDLMVAVGLGALTDVHWVLIRGVGRATEGSDLRADAASVVGYAVGRYAAGAPELHPR